MVVEFVLTALVLAAHTLLAAVVTRYLRLRMRTDWGTALYVLLLVPVLLVGATLVTGQLPLVPLGSPVTVFAVMIGVPLALGVAVDVLYLTPPGEYELPQPRSES
jgi:hypothetical protein